MGRRRDKTQESVLHKVARKPGQGVRLTSQTKEVIERVRRFFELEKERGYYIKRSLPAERTSEATGISRRTIDKIHREYLACDGQILTPMKRYAASRIRINPDSFDKAIIRRLVHQLYEAKVYPTLTNVLAKAKEEINFPGGRFCMWRVLRDLGFTYKKRDTRIFIYEILEQRHTYLQEIK